MKTRPKSFVELENSSMARHVIFAVTLLLIQAVTATAAAEGFTRLVPLPPPEIAASKGLTRPESGNPNAPAASRPDAAETQAQPRSLDAPSTLPAQTRLPDPLVMLDGRKVTTREMWLNERRPELIRLFQHYMYGRLPPKLAVAGKVERADAAAFGGKGQVFFDEISVVAAGESRPVPQK